jgi:hypothetical protein
MPVLCPWIDFCPEVLIHILGQKTAIQSRIALVPIFTTHVSLYNKRIHSSHRH